MALKGKEEKGSGSLSAKLPSCPDAPESLLMVRSMAPDSFFWGIRLYRRDCGGPRGRFQRSKIKGARLELMRWARGLCPPCIRVNRPTPFQPSNLHGLGGFLCAGLSWVSATLPSAPTSTTVPVSEAERLGARHGGTPSISPPSMLLRAPDAECGLAYP
jgi:hypothetical protein